MRNYSLLRTIPLSFYSKDLYRDVARNWPGLGFCYLLMLITVACIPFVVFFIIASFSVTLDEPFDANFIIDQVPQMHISSGEISTPAVQPHYIRAKETGEPIIIIDTTRPPSDWVKEHDKQNMVVIGKSQILIHNEKKKEDRLMDVADDIEATITREDVRGWAQAALGYLWILPILMALMLIPIIFLYRIIQALIYGLIGLGFKSLLHVNLTYPDLVRLAAVAITPALILSFVDYTNLLPGIVYLAIGLGYLFYAVRANKHDAI